MLHVDLDNILTHDELASKADEVLRKADDEGKIVVITRNGRPAVAVLKLETLEGLSGRTVSTQQPPVQIPNVETGAPMISNVSAPPPLHQSEAPVLPPPPAPMAEPPHDAPVASQISAPPPLPPTPNPTGLPDMPEL